MEETLDRIFGNLQRLEIQPTEHNVVILAECFAALREIYTKSRETGDGSQSPPRGCEDREHVPGLPGDGPQGAGNGPQGAGEAEDGEMAMETENAPRGAGKGEE